MRVVLKSHDEVAHVWAQQTQPRGRAGNMFFEGERIYSWGLHFCIARILPSGVVVYGMHTYSSSTGKHQSLVRSAVSHRRTVYCEDPDRTAWSNKEQAERAIKNALVDASTTRKVLPKTRVESKLSAWRTAQKFNEYLAALPPDEQGAVEPFDLAPLVVSEADRVLLREYEQRAQARREVKWEKDAQQRKVRLEKAALAEADKIVEWRAHVFNHSLYNVPTMLRLSKDKQNVETSKGADIPVSHAKRLWPLIENCRSVGKPLENRDVHLGHYTLHRIEANGDIVVGCHNIAYSEIEAIARQLGLIHEGEPA